MKHIPDYFTSKLKPRYILLHILLFSKQLNNLPIKKILYTLSEIMIDLVMIDIVRCFCS